MLFPAVALQPGTTVRTATTTVRANSTICVASSPRSSGTSIQILAKAMTGMVRPMLAIAEPRGQVQACLNPVPKHSDRRRASRAARSNGDHHAHERWRETMRRVRLL